MEVVAGGEKVSLMEKGFDFDSSIDGSRYWLPDDRETKKERIRQVKHVHRYSHESQGGSEDRAGDEQLSTAQRLVRDVLDAALVIQCNEKPSVLVKKPDRGANQIQNDIRSPLNNTGAVGTVQREVSSILAKLVIRHALRVTENEATYRRTLKEEEQTKLKLVSEMEEHYREKLRLAENNQSLLIQGIERKVKDELEKANYALEIKLSQLNLEQREREKSYKELEIAHKNSEKQLSNQVNSLYQRLSSVEQQEKETCEQNLQLQQYCKDLQMAHDQAKRELELEKERRNQLETENKVLLVDTENVKQQIEETRSRNDHQHLKDTNTLSLLKEQVDELRKERDSLHVALDSIRQSVASLIPLAPTIHAVLPSSSETGQPLVTLATPSGPKPVMTVGSVDSGLASQHPSIGRTNQGVWPTLPQTDGSVLTTLPQSPESVEADLSVSQISEGEELPPEDTYEPQYPAAAVSTAPELSILHINQSDSSIVVPAAVPNEIVNEVHVIQAMIEHLHQSIDALLKGYISVSTQADVYQTRLGQVQEDLVSSQSGITEQLKHIQQLQHQVEALETQIPSNKGNQEELTAQLYQANEKISTLIQQVEDMRDKNEETGRKSVNEVLELKQNLMTAEKELTAQRHLNRELKERIERLEVEARKKIEAVQSENKVLEVKLSEARKQATDCKRLSEQLSEKEETDGQLREEMRMVHDQLLAAQHQVATLESRDTTDTLILEKQLQSEKRISQELQERLNQVVDSFEKDAETFSKHEMALKQEIADLNGLISKKDSVLEGVRLEKEKIDSHCSELKEQVITLTEQVEGLHSEMKTSNEKVSQLCKCIEEKERELDSTAEEQTLLREKLTQIQLESKGHLEVYEQSVVQIQSLQEELEGKEKVIQERERELESQTVSNGELSERVTTLSKELQEKDQYYNRQVVELQEALSGVRRELNEKENELSSLKEMHIDELGQLEAKLLAEHRGRLALVKLQYTEKIKQIESNDQEMLEKIADLAPKLEKNSGDVKRLCEKTNIDGVKRVLREREMELAQVKAAVEQTSNSVSTLTSDNHQLKQELAEASETISGLEESMEQANITIEELRKKLEHLISEKDGLVAERSGLEARTRQLLGKEKSAAKELQERLDGLTAQYNAVQERAVAERNRALELEQRLLTKEEEFETLIDERKNRNDSALSDSQQDTRETLLKCLEGERAAVAKLTNTLKAKEAELTNAVDQYLQEKVSAAKSKGEVSALHSRIRELTQEITLLKSRNEQMISKLNREKQDIKDKLESLQTRLHKTSSRHGKVHVASEVKPLCPETVILLRAKQAERRCKALVFQKKYLQSEIDAFYHTHHGALMMIKDMGGAVRGRKKQRLTFKAVGVLVIAALRMQNLVKRTKRFKTSVSSPVQRNTVSRKTTPTYPRRTPRTQQGGDSITIVMSKKDCNEGTDPQITAYLNEIKRIQEQLNSKQ